MTFHKIIFFLDVPYLEKEASILTPSPSPSPLSRRQKKFFVIGFGSGKIILIEFDLNSKAESFVKFLNCATRRVQNIKRVSRFLGATIRFEL